MTNVAAHVHASLREALDLDALRPYLEPHEHEVSVYVEDTDFTGAMYHGRFLCYCGRARAELLGSQFIRDVHVSEGVGFVVHAASMRFRHPARFGDRLRIVTQLAIPSLHKLDFRHRAYRLPDGQPIADAEVRVVCVNAKGRPVPIPVQAFVDSRHQPRQAVAVAR